MESSKRRSLPWTIGGAVIGAVVFGLFGYFFGKYGLAETDLLKIFSALQDPDGVGVLSAWLLGLTGLVVGMRRGRYIAHRQERARRRRKERQDAAEPRAENQTAVASSTRPR